MICGKIISLGGMVMEVKDVVQKLQKQVSVNLTSMYAIKKKYLSLYRAHMVRLYDKGYISDPTYLDEREIRKNIKDYKISNMILNSLCKVNLTSQQADFALTANGIDEEGMEFLHILKDVLYYRECCLDIDKFYDSNNLVEGKKVNFKLVYAGSKIYTRMPYNITIPVLECAFSSRLFGKKICKVSMKPYVYEKALSILGIEDKGNGGIFVKGFSRDEEIRFCDLILNGQIDITGSEKEKLEGWLSDHAWNVNVKDYYKYIKTGLYSYIIEQEVEYSVTSRKKLLADCISKYGEENILFITTENIFYTCPNEYVEYPVSEFVIFAEMADRISVQDKNTMEGYTGEIYSVVDIDNEGGMYTGCPIEMYNSAGCRSLYVDFEQTCYCQNSLSVSWFSCTEGVSISFDRPYYVEGVFPEGSYEDQIFKVIGEGDGGTLIGKISAPKSKSEWDALIKAKDTVYEKVVKSGNIQKVKDILVMLYDGDTDEGVRELYGRFRNRTATCIIDAINAGAEFNWLLKTIVTNSSEIEIRNALKAMRGGRR